MKCMRDPAQQRSTKSDLELVEGARRGHARDFSLLVYRYSDRAFTLALRIVGNRETAEEVVQDAFLKVFRALPGFRGESAFGTWFYRILYNCCLTRNRKRGDILLDVNDLPGGEPALDEPLIDQVLEERELNTMVSEAVDALPAHQRSVVALYYIEEMTYEQVAEVMDLPLGTVKTNLFRARKRLKECVQKRAEEVR